MDEDGTIVIQRRAEESFHPSHSASVHLINSICSIRFPLQNHHSSKLHIIHNTTSRRISFAAAEEMNIFFFFFSNISVHLLEAHPTLVCVTTWMALIAAVVAAASLAPEAAFVWALSPASAFARACDGVGAVRLPLDAPPGEVLCFPAERFGRTVVDLLVPPVFAAVVVAGAACFVRAIALWEADEDPS